MTTRRGFMLALGMGGMSLGFPATVQAFGRRRRRGCCPPCPVEESAFNPIVPFQGGRVQCTRACPIQYYGQSNGVFYYLCECCSNGSSSTTINCTSPQYITTPQHCSDPGAVCLPMPVNGDPQVFGLAAGMPKGPVAPHCIFCVEHHQNGVVHINDPHNSHKNPKTFFDMPAGVKENNGAGTDVQYDCHGTTRYARLHEIEWTGNDFLRIGQPYKKSFPEFPGRFDTATFVNGVGKHDLISYKGLLYHVHQA